MLVGYVRGVFTTRVGFSAPSAVDVVRSVTDLTDFSFIRTPTTLSLLPPISELHVDDDTTAQPGRLSDCLLLSSLHRQAVKWQAALT